MKKMMRILVLSLVSVLGFSSAIFAKTITKPFEVGEGTAFATSNRRDFNVPCGLDVTAKVKYSRKGSADAANDIPLIIELVSPGNIGQSSQVVDTQNITAKTTAQTATLNGDKAENGCSAYWSVRVKTANSSAPFAVSGEISVTFNDAKFFAKEEGSTTINQVNLNAGMSVEKFLTFKDLGGLPQGVIEIYGVWFHNLGALPIKMRAELIDPNGNTVAQGEGYSNHEVNPFVSSQKLKVTFRNRTFIRGRWKLKMTNLSPELDSVRLFPSVAVTPDCP